MARGVRANLLGSTFGILRVVEEHAITKDRGALWVCQCECGNRLIRATRELRRGKRPACQACNAKLHIEQNTTHGLSRSNGGRPDPLYKTWLSMRERCNNPNHPFYKHYGGKGVKLCQEWESFEVFQAWSAVNGWRDIPDVPRGDRMSIDRINSSLGYSPSNCQWISHRVNAGRKSA